MPHNRATGQAAEQRAQAYLIERGWQPIAQNLHLRTTEIDLLMRDPQGSIVAVEVKYRSGDQYGHPLESVTKAKLTRLHEGLLAYAAAQDIDPQLLRIDVIVMSPEDTQYYKAVS